MTVLVVVRLSRGVEFSFDCLENVADRIEVVNAGVWSFEKVLYVVVDVLVPALTFELAVV